MLRKGKFDMGAIRAYTKRLEMRFDLFDSEQPFMQAPIKDMRTDQVEEFSIGSLMEAVQVIQYDVKPILYWHHQTYSETMRAS
jgi:hypothetical protein